MKEYRTNDAIGMPYGNCITVNKGTDQEYKQGHYTFKKGVVVIYAEPKLATFSFVYGGRMHGLTISDIKKPLSTRQLIYRAGKFAREIVAFEMSADYLLEKVQKEITTLSENEGLGYISLDFVPYGKELLKAAKREGKELHERYLFGTLRFVTF